MSLDNKFPTINVERLIKLVLDDAHNRRENAGFSDLRHDDGAGMLETQVKFYNYGRAGTIPPEWEKYSNQLDPEYQEYQRLKKKFGNK